MQAIRDENYYVVQGWMRTILGLKGNDLLIYAMLWSFSQDGMSEFRGSVEYMSDFIGVDGRTIRRILKKLEELTLIEKSELNEKTGKTNGYKCVPLEKVEFEKVGWTKCPTPKKDDVSGRTNCPTGADKMSYGADKMSTPLTIEREEKHISNLYKKEGKKEVHNNKPCASARIRTQEIPNFEKMSESEFVAFGENNVPDFADERSVEIFEAYTQEMERRAKEVKWQGKFIRDGQSIVKLKSYVEIFKGFGVKGAYADVLNEYLSFCMLNKRMMTNKQLETLLFQLHEKYGNDEVAKTARITSALESKSFKVFV